MEKINVAKKLMHIQNEIKAPKSQINKFGNYKYRSCEDIMEGLKPVLLKYDAALVLTNDLEVINGMIFRKSVATLLCCSSDEKISVHTYTQESLSKKGMSPEQCSGSAASYGDKYVLSKMFLIDDTKDADTQDNSKQQKRDYKKEKELRDKIVNLCSQKCEGMSPPEKMQWFKQKTNLDHAAMLNQCDENKLNEILNKLQNEK